MIEISFIVPAYNVEKYIEKCVKSILIQDIEKEIIIVNDGSTDNTLKIVEKLSAQYSEIKVITKKNAGLSDTRNEGLKYAKGKYVWFVDSDDWILPNSAKKMLEECNKNNLDIIRGKYQIYDDEKKELKEIRPSIDNKEYVNKTFSGRNLLDKLLKDDRYEVTAWLGLFKREFLENNKLVFIKGVTYEDHEFMIKSFLADNCKTMIIDTCIYIYRQRGNSITKRSKINDLYSIQSNLNNMFSLYKEISDVKEKKLVLKAMSGLYYQYTCVYYRVENKEKKKIKFGKFFKFQMMKHSLNYRQKFKLLIFNYFKELLLLYYNAKGK